MEKIELGYVLLSSVLDLIDAVRDVFSKEDLVSVIKSYESFKEDNSVEDVYIDFDFDGHFCFYTEEECEEIIEYEYELIEDEEDSIECEKPNYDEEDSIECEKPNEKPNYEEIIGFQNKVIQLLLDKSESSLNDLAIEVNDISNYTTLIPVKNGVPTIELEYVLDKVAPSSFQKQVLNTIMFASKSISDDEELSLILLSGSHMGLLGTPVTSYKQLSQVLDGVVKELTE